MRPLPTFTLDVGAIGNAYDHWSVKVEYIDGDGIYQKEIGDVYLDENGDSDGFSIDNVNTLISIDTTDQVVIRRSNIKETDVFLITATWLEKGSAGSILITSPKIITIRNFDDVFKNETVETYNGGLNIVALSTSSTSVLDIYLYQ